jgi:prepilin-type N-terminal cleavage/methylation domain-containing protein
MTPIQGFTLVEVMVAVLLTGLMVSGALAAFSYQRRVLRANEITSEMRHNVRTAMDMITRDVRTAGYGLDCEESEVRDWIAWTHTMGGAAVTMDANPKIVDGSGGAPDAIWIAAAFGPPRATLAMPAALGSTTLRLGNGQGAQFQSSQRRVLFLGKTETIRVTDVSGDTLTISTDPTQTSGLRYDHPAGTLVELVMVRSYEHNDGSSGYPHLPHITRDDNQSDTYNHTWERLIANAIEDLQLNRVNNRVEIEITGRASAAEWYYQHPTENDAYRRTIMASSAFMRNLR